VDAVSAATGASDARTGCTSPLTGLEDGRGGRERVSEGGTSEVGNGRYSGRYTGVAAAIAFANSCRVGTTHGRCLNVTPRK
jgi:hypothetical protein